MSACARALTFLVALFLLGGGLLGQNEVKPELERDVMRYAATFLERQHLAHRVADDEISRRAFQALMNELDPARVYFFARDVKAFRIGEELLDDSLIRGDMRLMNKICDTWEMRVQQAANRVERLLAKELDLSDEEFWITEREDLPWPEDAVEMDERWRKRLELDTLGLLDDGKTREEAKEALRKRYRRFAERVDKENREDRLSRFLGVICRSYDPHTTYMAPSDWQDFLMGVTLNYQGIGALLTEEDGYVTISEVMKGGSVQDQGLIKAGDKILAVGQGKSGPLTDIVGWRTRDAVKLIRGKEGTFVRLKISPKNGPERVDVLPRKRIQLEERAAQSEVIALGSKPRGGAYRVGVIQMPGFYRDRSGGKSSTKDCERFLSEFKEQDVDICVLDLRTNGGGYLSEAISVAGLFLDRGAVVQVKGRRDAVVRRDRRGGMEWEGPLVVLTSRASASASEIVAGAIQDWRRGLVVGDDTTHGKGTVQTTLDLADEVGHEAGRGALGILKFTIQQFYRPNGLSTQVRGVSSDVRLPAWSGVAIKGEGELPHAYPPTRIDPTRYEPLDWVSASMTERLQKQSDERRARDAWFQKLERRIAAYRAMKAKESLPLRKSDYDALQASLREVDEAKEEEDEEERALKDDPWFQEVLRIAVDYASILEKERV